MTSLVCVLRSGGDFDERWVTALWAGLRRHLLAPHRLVCLTDMGTEDAPYGEPLRHDWPGWWAKMNALDPALWTPGERVVLMDLDTLPVGNLYRLASLDVGDLGYPDFAMLRAMNKTRAARGKLVSGIVAFRAGEDTGSGRLYRLFAEDPERWMDTYRGDGEFLHGEGRDIAGIQDRVPGIYSYKWEARGRCPADAVLCIGHGAPRFSDPKAGWAHRLWTERASSSTEPEATENAA